MLCFYAELIKIISDYHQILPIIYSSIYEWSFCMKFMKQAFGVFHMKFINQAFGKFNLYLP